MAKRQPGPIDRAIGQHIHDRRKSFRYSQETLARAIGVSDAAIGKMERAESSVPARDLYLIAKYLKADLYAFFKKPIESLSGPGLEEAGADFAIKIDLPEFMERVSDLLRECPEEARSIALTAIGELGEKLKSEAK